MHTCTTQEARAKLSSWSLCRTLTWHIAVLLWTSLHLSAKSWHSPRHWRENQTLNWRNWESYSCQRKRLQGLVNWSRKCPSYTIWTWRKRRTIKQTVVSVWIWSCDNESAAVLYYHVVLSSCTYGRATSRWLQMHENEGKIVALCSTFVISQWSIWRIIRLPSSLSRLWINTASEE